MEGTLTYPLHVAVRDTGSTGTPGQVLAETTLSTPGATLSQLITFPQNVPIVAGTQYAIVADYPSAPLPSKFGGSWFGATGNPYAGQAWKSIDGVSWDVLLVGADQHFRAYVRP